MQNFSLIGWLGAELESMTVLYFLSLMLHPPHQEKLELLRLGLSLSWAVLAKFDYWGLMTAVDSVVFLYFSKIYSCAKFMLNWLIGGWYTEWQLLIANDSCWKLLETVQQCYFYLNPKVHSYDKFQVNLMIGGWGREWPLVAADLSCWQLVNITIFMFIIKLILKPNKLGLSWVKLCWKLAKFRFKPRSA